MVAVPVRRPPPPARRNEQKKKTEQAVWVVVAVVVGAFRLRDRLGAAILMLSIAAGEDSGESI